MGNFRFEIGETAWMATFDSCTAYLTCPDCAGTGYNRVILPEPDNTVVTIECEGCRHGFEGSDGRLRVYDRKAKAVLVTVMGVSLDGGKIEWRTSESYCVADADLFDTEEAAQEAARVLAFNENERERLRHLQKEKPLKSWSWHVHYHQQCIREAKRQIEYHSGKLDVAHVRATKEQRAKTPT